jgi:hypothetical protein
MFNNLIIYIITLLLSVIIFCSIPKKLNPVTNIYLFILLILLGLYFIDNNTGILEYFNNNNNIKDISNNILSNNDEGIFEEPAVNEPKLTPSLKLKSIIHDGVKKLQNNEHHEKIDLHAENKDISHNTNTNTNDKLITLSNVHINIQNLVLPYLEMITYNENTIKFKPQITDIIISIKQKDEPYDIYNKIEKVSNLLKDSNSEFYDFIKQMTLILNSIIYQKPIVLKSNIHFDNSNVHTPLTEGSSDHGPTVQSDNTMDLNSNLYIKKHFLPLFEKLLLVVLSYNKLPDNLQSKIININKLIDNDANINNILKKIKEVNNDILTVLNDKQIISDKLAKTYLLMSKTTLDVIIKNYKLIILQEPLDLKTDILQLNKDMELIMKTHLGKILKLFISLEYNSLDNSNIKTYLSVDFNSAVKNVTIDNDSSNTQQISDMLKQLANKIETSNNECNCENKVKEAVDKYLKNGKYIDDNGIIQNIMNSDMIYNQLDVSMLQSLGSYDNSFTNKWDKGYTYLDTTKWTVPKVHLPSPPNMNNILSSLTPGYPINVLEFDNSRKVLGSDNINLQYIKEKLN